VFIDRLIAHFLLDAFAGSERI